MQGSIHMLDLASECSKTKKTQKLNSDVCSKKVYCINMWTVIIGVFHKSIEWGKFYAQKLKKHFVQNAKQRGENRRPSVSVVNRSQVHKTKINRHRSICITVIKIVFQLSADELSINGKNFNILKNPNIMTLCNQVMAYLSSWDRTEMKPCTCQSVFVVIYRESCMAGNLQETWRLLYLLLKALGWGLRDRSSSGLW